MGELVFSDHVLSDEFGEDVPEAVLVKLESRLRGQLRKRGLLGLPPRILGYQGSSWDSESLRDLATDCYCHIFIGMSDKNPGGKLINWKLDREIGNVDIEKKVSLSIKNFIHDLQQKSDPEGTAVFKNLRRAVTELLESSELHVVGDSSSFSADWLCGKENSGSDSVEYQRLLEFVGSSDLWYPALGAIRNFSRNATNLAKEGVKENLTANVCPFVFKDLNTAAREKSYLPAENAAHGTAKEYSSEDENIFMEVRTWLESDSYQEKEKDFEELKRLIHVGIDELERRKPIKEKLHQIVEIMAVELRDSAYSTVVSQAQVARDLGIAKQTLNDHMKEIRKVTAEVRDAS